MDGDPRASAPLALKGWGTGRKSWTSKDRCRSKFKRLRTAVTDKLLSASSLYPRPPSLLFCSSSGHLSSAKWRRSWSRGAGVTFDLTTRHKNNWLLDESALHDKMVVGELRLIVINHDES